MLKGQFLKLFQFYFQKRDKIKLSSKIIHFSSEILPNSSLLYNNFVEKNKGNCIITTVLFIWTSIKCYEGCLLIFWIKGIHFETAEAEYTNLRTGYFKLHAACRIRSVGERAVVLRSRCVCDHADFHSDRNKFVWTDLIMQFVFYSTKMNQIIIQALNYSIPRNYSYLKPYLDYD